MITIVFFDLFLPASFSFPVNLIFQHASYPNNFLFMTTFYYDRSLSVAIFIISLHNYLSFSECLRLASLCHDLSYLFFYLKHFYCHLLIWDLSFKL